MKFEIKLGNINIQGIEIKDIEVKAEYSLDECVGAYELARTVISELPETLEMLKAGALKFHKIDREFDDIHKKEMEDLRAFRHANHVEEELVNEEPVEEVKQPTVESFADFLSRHRNNDNSEE